MPGTARPADMEFILLQAIRLKGWLAPEMAAIFIGSASTELIGWLAARELVTVGARGVRLTASGRERLSGFLALERGTIDLETVAGLYEEFHPHNAALKEVVGAWQARDGSPNEHTDAAYDRRVIARLESAHADAAPLVGRVVAAVHRLFTYPVRLGVALGKVTSGERAWFASPMLDSYHQVWFELHEELIGVLGLSRSNEAKSGHA